MEITTEDQLVAHLKVLKYKMKKQGIDPLNFYPSFCLLYDKNKDQYKLPNGVVLDKACDILIG